MKKQNEKCPQRQALNRLRELIKTETDKCILWPYGKADKLYGRVRYQNKPQRTHVVAWLLANNKNEVPKDKLIRHSCDVGLCVNPRHLSIGTDLDNMTDCKNRGRNIRADRHPMAKLNSSKVLRIYKIRHIPRRMIAAMFGVSVSTIKRIHTKTGWKSVL